MENLVDLGRLKLKLEQERKLLDEKLQAIALVEQMLASEAAQVEPHVTSALFSEKLIKDACVDVVNASERHLTTADVLDHLLRGGAKFTTNRPVNTVAATLNRLAVDGRISTRKKSGRVYYFRKDRNQLQGRGGGTDTNYQDITHAQQQPMTGPTRTKTQSRRAHILQFAALHPDGIYIDQVVRELQNVGWDTNTKKVRSLVWRLKDEGRIDTLKPGCFVLAESQHGINESSNGIDVLESDNRPLGHHMGLEDIGERKDTGEDLELVYHTE